jgi:hypothetical protein
VKGDIAGNQQKSLKEGSVEKIIKCKNLLNLLKEFGSLHSCLWPSYVKENQNCCFFEAHSEFQNISDVLPEKAAII